MVDDFTRGTTQQVNTADGMVRLVVMNADEPLPGSFFLWPLRAEGKVILRMAGGTSIEDEANKAALVDTFTTVAKRRTFNGALMSGGTRMIRRSVAEVFETDMLIVEIPSIFKRYNPNSGMVALGSVPRTAQYMSMRGAYSSFYLNDDPNTDCLANPDLDCLLVVQVNASEVAEWNGDVETYIRIMTYLRDQNGFRPGVMTWNGGGVTAKEIRGSLAASFPTLLFEGSGRIADGTIECRDILRQGGAVSDFPVEFRKPLGSWLTGDAAFDTVHYEDPDGLEAWLDANRFLVPAV